TMVGSEMTPSHVGSSGAATVVPAGITRIAPSEASTVRSTGVVTTPAVGVPSLTVTSPAPSGITTSRGASLGSSNSTGSAEVGSTLATEPPIGIVVSTWGPKVRVIVIVTEVGTVEGVHTLPGSCQLLLAASL